MSAATNNKLRSKAECDCCSKIADLELVGSGPTAMWQCPACIADDAAVAVSKILVVQTMRTMDSQTLSKDDILRNNPIELINVRAAINANTEIANDSKGFVWMEECEKHVLSLQASLAADRAELKRKEDLLAMWRVNGQEEFPKLRAEHQERFAKLFNPGYAPLVKPAKKRKEDKPLIPSKPVPGSRSGKAPKFNIVELNELEKKYGVDNVRIRRLSIVRGISAEKAAQILAKVEE